jgi:Ca-activated chloride channel family protein
MRYAPIALGAFLAVLAWPPDDPDATIRAGVSLVQLQATVTRADGRTVPGLGKDAFELLVDGVKRPITVFQGEDAPVTAGIVIDNSASMVPKRSDVVAAALAFARASNPRDEMFVVHFSDDVRFGLPEKTRFTGDIAKLERAIAKLNPGGTTALYDALILALDHFDGSGPNRRALLVITDGGDNSSQRTLEDALSAARAKGAALFAIGIYNFDDRDRNPLVLSRLAEATGGQAFFPATSAEVPRVCKRIAADIRRQYTLGFPGEKDNKYHSIQLTARDPRYGSLKVRTRAGYFAAKP